jgi:hypothetical protein
MNCHPSGNHIIIYYDAAMDAADGRGWCVEASDSDMTTRFGTMAGSLAYARTEENWLQKPASPVVI